MPSTVATLLPLEAVVQLLSGAVAQPYSLQQHAVCPRLLLGGGQRLVGSGSGIPGSLLLPPLELLVDPVGLLGVGASDPLLHLSSPIFSGEADSACALFPTLSLGTEGVMVAMVWKTLGEIRADQRELERPRLTSTKVSTERIVQTPLVD